MLYLDPGIHQNKPGNLTRVNGFKFSQKTGRITSLCTYTKLLCRRTMALDHSSFVDGCLSCCFPSWIKTALEPLIMIWFPDLIPRPHFQTSFPDLIPYVYIGIVYLMLKVLGLGPRPNFVPRPQTILTMHWCLWEQASMPGCLSNSHVAFNSLHFWFGKYKVLFLVLLKCKFLTFISSL